MIFQGSSRQSSITRARGSTGCISSSHRSARYLSAHLRTSRERVPDHAPRGIIRRDNAFVFNDADYQRLSPAAEEEMRFVAGHLGTAMQRAIERKFETSPVRSDA